MVRLIKIWTMKDEDVVENVNEIYIPIDICFILKVETNVFFKKKEVKFSLSSYYLILSVLNNLYVIEHVQMILDTFSPILLFWS